MGGPGWVRSSRRGLNIPSSVRRTSRASSRGFPRAPPQESAAVAGGSGTALIGASAAGALERRRPRRRLERRWRPGRFIACDDDHTAHRSVQGARSGRAGDRPGGARDQYAPVPGHLRPSRPRLLPPLGMAVSQGGGVRPLPGPHRPSPPRCRSQHGLAPRRRRSVCGDGHRAAGPQPRRHRVGAPRSAGQLLRPRLPREGWAVAIFTA